MARGALIIVALGIILALVGWVAAYAPGGPSSGDDRLVIAAYSVLREALHDGVLPAFAADWQKRTGRAVRFEESYNASGAQTRAMLGGFDADIALLALASDLGKLVAAGQVDSGWDRGPDRGIVTHSLVVIGHRPGNPLAIRDWADLAQPGLRLLVPDPKTSGGARWATAAIYGAELLRAGPEAARDLLGAIQRNVVAMDATGRQSMATFERGIGDAIVTYEHELRLKQRLTGVEVPYVIPAHTLLIEGPGAIVESSVARHGNRRLAEAFLAFLRGDEAQRILTAYGFRPLRQASAAGPRSGSMPAGVFTIDDLGGWLRLNRDLFGRGGVWDSLFTAGARVP